MVEIIFIGGRRFGGPQCGLIEKTKHPADAFVALPLPRRVLWPTVDDTEYILPKRTIEVAFNRASGAAACSSSLQYKRTAREITGAHEVIEQSRKNDQGLAAAALGDRKRVV